MDGKNYGSGLASLFSSIARDVEKEQCCCYEYMGDNKRCPKHGAHWVGKDPKDNAGKNEKEAGDEK